MEKIRYLDNPLLRNIQYNFLTTVIKAEINWIDTTGDRIESKLESLLWIKDDHFASFLKQSFIATFLLLLIVKLVSGKLPGHPNGHLWPIYIPEHYGGRNSQHFLDPYR